MKGKWTRGDEAYPAACEMPPGGIPRDSHMLRVSPCHGIRFNRVVFCAIVKITEGQNPLIQGHGDIVQTRMAIGGNAKLTLDDQTQQCKKYKTSRCRMLKMLKKVADNADGKR